MLGKEKSLEILEKALKLSKADETEVLLMGHNHCLSRYANSQIHQNVAEVNTTLHIKAVVGSKIGVTSINSFDPESISIAVNTAHRIALTQKDIENYSGLPDAVEIPEIQAYFPRTAEINAEEKALIIQDMIVRTHGDKMTLNGAFYTGASEVAVANSNGLSAYHIGTKSNIVALTSGKDVSGYASMSSRNVDDIDYTRLVEESLASAKKYNGVRNLEPGKYPVILEEYAVAEMLIYLSDMALTADSVENEHSFVVPEKGKKLFGEHINLFDDAMNPATFMMACDYEGVPKKRLDFIRGGVVTGNYTHNNFTAGKEGVKSTGHALPPGSGISRSYPFQMFMDTGKHSYNDMLKEMGTGVLVKRFHYLTAVHPLKTIISGMTRDGVFWVENGEITGRLNNMRFTQSIIEALKNVKALSNTRKLIWFRDFTLNFPLCMMVPRLYIEDFNFTGQTEF